MSMKEPVVYLAARYSRRKELRGYAKELRSRGIRIRARWLSAKHKERTAEAERTYAIEDLLRP